jgi:hypothetical protein
MTFAGRNWNRRDFVRVSAFATGAALIAPSVLPAAERHVVAALPVTDLPKGGAPKPVGFPHFPDRLHAFVWRNWSLVPADKLAAVVGTTRSEILRLGRSMGLPRPPRITRSRQRRSYITILKRNWHVLPYEQLLALLDWTPEEMAFTLREDDFLYIKLGSLKPQCEPLKFSPPDAATSRRALEIARVIREEFPDGLAPEGEPLFDFVTQLSKSPPASSRPKNDGRISPCFCYSYFALYGDPLLEPEADPYPDGYLARLAAVGVDGVWLQAVLYKLAPFPWDAKQSDRSEERLGNLRRLVARARRHGMRVYLYLNEPRALPLRFFESRTVLKGSVEGDHASLCTSHPDVQKYLRDSIASIARAVPDLGGFFTISASENLTNCWSHGAGGKCPRCGHRPPADVIAEVNRLIDEGIQHAVTGDDAGATHPGRRPALFAWDWGWNDAWAEGIIKQLPKTVALMSVSEWSLPIERGGVKAEVGEYSISAIGPGPRATRHWKFARDNGLKTLAKIQAGNTWELSAVPYIPALENVARHAANLRNANIDGLMLGWTLGGYPSPNLEVVAEIAGATDGASLSPDETMHRIALRRFGKSLAPHVVTAWRQCSAAFREFPYHIGVVYSAPLQVGPANPLWEHATGYHSSMVGFPYDHLAGWRSIYPAELFIQQLEMVSAGFNAAVRQLTAAASRSRTTRRERTTLSQEIGVATAAAIHFQSVANQSRFVRDRDLLATTTKPAEAARLLAALEESLRDELILARRLFALQSRDSRIGFEASNQYYYVPLDLAEKVLNCRDLTDRWLPEQRAHWTR